MERYIIAALFFFGSAVLGLARLMAMRYERGFRPGKTETALGRLTFFENENNVSIKRGDKRNHRWTKYTYTYEVNGKTYDRTGIVIDRYNPMPSSTKVIYQPGKPKYAYLPEFEFQIEGDYRFWHRCAAAFFVMGLFALFG